MANLVSIFAASVRQHGARPVLGTRADGAWSWLSYSEFARCVDELRAGLATLGVERGDRVAIVSRNRLEWAVACYAALGLGAAFVPMYEAQSEREWRHILADSGAVVCFVSGGSVGERLSPVAREVPALKHIVDFDAAPGVAGSYPDLLAVGRQRPVEALTPDDRDIAKIVYTSGTTGTPKGVLLTHGNIASNVDAVTSVVSFSIDDRSLSFLPWAHVFGANELHGIIAIGASTAICESVDGIASQLLEVRPTLLFAVPRIWNRVYQTVQQGLASKPRALRRLVDRAARVLHRNRAGTAPTVPDRLALAVARALVFGTIRRRFGGRLRYAVSAAAALAPEVAEFIDDLGIVVLEAYGLTESSACATINRPDDRRIGSVGKPIPGVRIALDQAASGAEGGAGEIVVYGHCVMAGYHHLPEETARTLTADGGLRTGDLGRIDADGFLFVTGRLKELYKLENGKYVAPAVLEEQLTMSAFIDQAFVHGANRPHNVALIVPNRAALETWASSRGLATASFEGLLREPKVVTLLRDELAGASVTFKGFERVAAFALLAEPLSVESGLLTPTLKVKRRKVLERYQALIEGLYASAPAQAAGSAVPPERPVVSA